MAATLADLIMAERECFPFLTFQLTAEPKGPRGHPCFGFLYKGIIDFPRAAMVSVRWKPTWVGCKRALPLGDVLASNWLPIQGKGQR